MLPVFLDLALAMDRVKERSSLSSPVQDSYIEEILTLSAGSTPDQPLVYRPYYVAALILEQDVSRQQLTKAGDVEFTQFITVIQSLRSLQYAFDLANKLTLPPGMEIVIPELISSKYIPSVTQALKNNVSF